MTETQISSTVCTKCGVDRLYYDCGMPSVYNCTFIGYNKPIIDYVVLHRFASKNGVNYSDLCVAVREAVTQDWLKTLEAERARCAENIRLQEVYCAADVESARSNHIKTVNSALTMLQDLPTALSRRLPKVKAVSAVLDEVISDLKTKAKELKSEYNYDKNI